jgi:anti-sigma factor RsiW
VDCQMIDAELTGFHFGVLEEATRANVEQHLATCARCVQAFLALKRAIERAPDERPSDVARARLRAAVEREVVAPARGAPRRAWTGAAAAVALFLIAALLGVFAPRDRARAELEDVDSARPMAASLRVM